MSVYKISEKIPFVDFCAKWINFFCSFFLQWWLNGGECPKFSHCWHVNKYCICKVYLIPDTDHEKINAESETNSFKCSHWSLAGSVSLAISYSLSLSLSHPLSVSGCRGCPTNLIHSYNDHALDPQQFASMSMRQSRLPLPIGLAKCLG